MPNTFDASGLQVKTRAELVSEWTTNFQTIYGPDIVLSSDSPDGQMMNLFIQAILDQSDLLVQVNSGFDPDQAVGITLDARAAYNGIKRKGGTFTVTNISVEVDRALNLAGLDSDIDDPNGTGYTVQDASGNKWILDTSQSFGAPGTYVVAFRAQNSGAVLTSPNTITIPVTTVLGVVGVNNPTTYTTLGEDEETDAEFRLRRQKSTSLSSQGYLAGLLAALLEISSLSSAIVIENNSDGTDSDGIPGHSIWVIVQGGDAASIANAIYTKRNAGAGMKGSQSLSITQVDGTAFIVRWDNVVSEDLYMKFTITSMDGVTPVDATVIKNGLVTRLVPGIFERVNINELGTIVQEIDPNCLVVPTVGDGFGTSGGGPFTTTLLPDAKNKQFAVAAAHMAVTVV